MAQWGGWKAVLGTNGRAVCVFRISLGMLLLTELVLRFRFLHPFYSDEGTFPTYLLRPKIDILYRCICIHQYSGSLLWQTLLLAIQCLFALSLTIGGPQSRYSAHYSWFLYLSLTLRNTWLNFILDRYFHYTLFYLMFLPTCKNWSLDGWRIITGKKTVVEEDQLDANGTFVTVATIAFKAQVFWLYLDAGQGKFNDPLGGWTWNADPLPALDTYARHTVVARYMYSALGPSGLRLLTPTVVWVEMLAAPIALFGSLLGHRSLVNFIIGLVCSLHIGIALTVRNTVLLSLVACSAWSVFLPPPLEQSDDKEKMRPKPIPCFRNSLLGTLAIFGMICGSIWFEGFSMECNQSMKHIWSTLLHNRWNVFIGAEEYVTWEIAPGRLSDGSVVDVWGRKHDVEWDMPGTGAPCTSTARPGRWRSFPYLAELDGEEGDVLWNYLCKQWDFENDVHKGNDGKKLLRYNFFMLQADVLPNMGFSSTRKRKIHSHICHNSISQDTVDIDNQDDVRQYEYNDKERRSNASEL